MSHEDHGGHRRGRVTPVTTAVAVTRRLQALADPAQAAVLQRFFKTGPGEYAEGDRFLGVKVPAIRALARESGALPLAEAARLLRSPWHEARALALVILVRQYAGAAATSP